MFRFARSGSVFFRFFSWLFVASLFCDGANLDDLLGGRRVIHDDFEMAAPGSGGLSGLAIAAMAGPHDLTRATLLFPSTPPHDVPVLVVIDQDSPSLEADCRKIAIHPFSSLPDFGPEFHDGFLSAGILHIRLRSILI